MAPTVYLVSTPRFHVDAFLSFLADQGVSWKRTREASEPEEIVEVAGRICYMSFGDKQSPRSNPEYIRRLIAMEHESVLEHVNWGFVLTGVSRAFSHQLVRHRPGFAFSQISQQYHEETDAQFVEPQLKLPPQAQVAWNRAIHTAKEAYKEILQSLAPLEGDTENDEAERREMRRAIRATARSVLPNATETKLFMTANARGLRHFFRVRGSIPGDLEMRQVASAMLAALKKEAPSFFVDFEIQTADDGHPIVIKKELK